MAWWVTWGLWGQQRLRWDPGGGGDRWSWGAAEISGKKTSLGAQKHLVLLVPRDLGSRTV